MSNIAFRADASFRLGTGHLMRCLTLADSFAAAGDDCTFVCSEAAGSLIELIRERGHAVRLLPDGDAEGLCSAGSRADDQSDAARRNCLDAERTRSALVDVAVDCIVVDHYALQAVWERSMRAVCDCLCVIDDLADRTHDCDALLDQNWFGASTRVRYDGRLPDHCVRMLGPRYALLAPEYAALRTLLPPRDGLVRRVLVFFGGSDATNETAKALDALAGPALAELAVDVVIGASHPDPDGVAARVRARPRTNLHRRMPTLAGLIFKADYSFGAGGTTGWERMALGLPGVVIGVAENQMEGSRALAEEGYLSFAGRSQDVDPVMLADLLVRTKADADLLRRQSVRMQQLVPVDGAARVREAIRTLIRDADSSRR